MPRGGEEKLRPLDFELETLVPNRAHLYGTRLLPGSEAASRLETKRTLSFHKDLESFHFDEMESSGSQGERERASDPMPRAELSQAWSCPLPLPGTRLPSRFLDNYHTACVFQFKCPCPDSFTKSGPLRHSSLHRSYIKTWHHLKVSLF